MNNNSRVRCSRPLACSPGALPLPPRRFLSCDIHPGTLNYRCSRVALADCLHEYTQAYCLNFNTSVSAPIQALEVSTVRPIPHNSLLKPLPQLCTHSDRRSDTSERISVGAFALMKYCNGPYPYGHASLQSVTKANSGGCRHGSWKHQQDRLPKRCSKHLQMSMIIPTRRRIQRVCVVCHCSGPPQHNQKGVCTNHDCKQCGGKILHEQTGPNKSV